MSEIENRYMHCVDWKGNGRMPILMEMLSYFAVSEMRQYILSRKEWHGEIE